jgi:hypothetical protein
MTSKNGTSGNSPFFGVSEVFEPPYLQRRFLKLPQQIKISLLSDC